MNSPDPKTNSDQKTLPKLRTFAKDLEHKRVGKSETQTKPKEAVTNPAPPQTNTKTETPLYQKPKWDKVEKPAAKKTTVAADENLSNTSYLHQAPASLTTNEADIVIENDEADIEGHIIRDTKKNRFNLFTAIGASLNKWVQNFKQRQIEKRKPKYSVPDSTHRKGVIQRATSKTGKVTSFDTQSIQERVREREAKIKPRIPETVWTPNTEPGFALIEGAHTEPETPATPKPPTINDLTPTNVTVEPRKSVHAKNLPIIQNHETSPTTPEEDTPPKIQTPVSGHNIPPAKTIEPNSRIATAFTLNSEAPKNVTSETTPDPVSPPSYPPAPETTEPRLETKPSIIPVDSIDAENSEPTPKPSPLSSRQRVTSPNQNRGFKKWLLLENTNRQSLAISILLIVVLIIGAVIFSITNRQIKNLETTYSYNYKNLIEAPLQPISYTGQSRQELLTLIRQNVTQSGYPLQQLVLTADQGTTGNQTGPLDPGSVMLNLGLQPSPSQNLNIAEIYFGSINQRPFIIMRSTNFNSALGGMLAWEGSLYREILDLLDLKATSQGEFRDVVLGTIDTRIFRDTTDGSEIFVYGIVDRRYIIIAQNRMDFTNIANNIVKP